ncbi:MAG: glycosyltransferase family 4 protein [Nitrososphaerota archaeon]
MKVLLVNPTFGGASGTGRHVQLLSKGLREEDIDVSILDGRNTWSLNIPMMKSASFLVGLLFKKFQADVVHLHNPKLSPLIFKHRNTIITIHGGMNEYMQKYGLMGRLVSSIFLSVMKKSRVVTTVLKTEAERYGWTWIPNMTDIRTIDQIKPINESFVLFVGRNDPIKNYQLFKKIVTRLNLKYKAFGVEEIADWKTVISYMKSAKCLFITSIWEGMPSVLLEAWAAECPVIASEIEAFLPFRDALILSKPKLEEMINAYNNLELVRDKIVKNGRRYSEMFDYPKVVKKYLRIYEYLLSN